MEIKELRIGNIIKANNINAFRVDEMLISEHHGYIVRMNISYIPEKSYIDLPISMADPILLTDEVLLKCGFKTIYKRTESEQHTMNKIKIGYEITFINRKNNFDRISLIYIGNEITREKHFHMHIDNVGLYNDIKTNIRYLHELQNIYYDLSKKELNVI